MAEVGALRVRAALALMLLSGFAGLGYQIVWTQQGALWLGHEAPAVLAVVAAFFGGLSLGALLLGARIERSARPARWYAGCELLIGCWSGVLAVGMAPFSNGLLAAIGAQPGPAWQWTLGFGGTFIILLPATAAMGATLPALERALALSGLRRQPIAALYACNTLGAMLGVLATAGWLLPQIGLARTAGLCAALNVVCAVAALWRFGRSAPIPIPISVPAPALPAAQRLPLLRLAATGLLGIGYEVLVVRVLSQVTEDTVYTFALLLAVYLAGTAIGAAAYTRAPARWRASGGMGGWMLGALACACVLGGATLWAAESVRDTVQQALPAGIAGALAAEAVLALLAFVLPTVLMGALFSHLATQARAVGISLGRALGFNTLGAALAPALFGVGLVPALGTKSALLLVPAGYLLLGIQRPRRWNFGFVAAAVAAGVALALWAPPLAFVDVPEGGRIVSYREGALAAVSVVEDGDGVARLRINNRQQEGSSATLLADARQALLPLLLHPAPQRALFLGLGTGVTASSAAEDPALHVDVAELLPEVIAASSHFTARFNGGAPNPRLQLLAADARRFVKAPGPAYDLIVSDNFHPARSGSGALYTVEHFAAVRQRLAADGVFCQWLPLHQLDLQTLRSIVQSFIAVYPSGAALLATHSLDTPVLGLVTRRDGGRFDLQALRQRLHATRLPQDLAAYGIADDLALFGTFIAGPPDLRRFAGAATLNTDDRPVVAYTAPRLVYAPDSGLESQPRDRLLALLHQFKAAPAQLVDAGADAAWPAKLAGYWAARDRFIAAGRSVRPTVDVQAMLAQVRAPLLSVLQLSPDFRPAYDPLLRMALALARSDALAAQALLTELARAQPARAEAPQALLRLALP